MTKKYFLINSRCILYEDIDFTNETQSFFVISTLFSRDLMLDNIAYQIYAVKWFYAIISRQDPVPSTEYVLKKFAVTLTQWYELHFSSYIYIFFVSFFIAFFCVV